jgi:hypothetical protein
MTGERAMTDEWQMPLPTDHEDFTAERMIEMYREQIKYMQAENERLNLLVGLSYTPPERYGALATEWRPTNSSCPMCQHQWTYDTMNDAIEARARYSLSTRNHFADFHGAYGPFMDSQTMQYRFVTPWKDSK